MQQHNVHPAEIEMLPTIPECDETENTPVVDTSVINTQPVPVSRMQKLYNTLGEGKAEYATMAGTCTATAITCAAVSTGLTYACATPYLASWITTGVSAFASGVLCSTAVRRHIRDKKQQVEKASENTNVVTTSL